MGNLNVKPPSTRKDVLQDYHSSASVGGLPQSYNAYYKYLRGMWIFLVIAGLVATIVHSIDVISEYRNYPIQVTISIETKQQLPIPGVTICNLNPVRKSTVQCGSMAKLAGIQEIPSAPTLRSKEIDQHYQKYVEKKAAEIPDSDYYGTAITDAPEYRRKDYWLADRLKMDTYNFFTSYKTESCSGESTDVEPYYYVDDIGDGSNKRYLNYDNYYEWETTDITSIYYERPSECGQYCKTILPEQTGKILSILSRPLYQRDIYTFKYEPITDLDSYIDSSNIHQKNENGEYEQLYAYFRPGYTKDLCMLYYYPDYTTDNPMEYTPDDALYYPNVTTYVIQQNWTAGIGHYIKYNGCGPEGLEPICRHMTNCSHEWWSEDNKSEFGEHVSTDESYDWGLLLENATLDDFQDVRDIFSFEPYMKDMGYQPQDFIIECTIDRKKCDPKKDFHQTFEKHYGNCYTFNRAIGKQNPNTTSKSGNSYGLRLTLDIGADDYLGLLAPEYGARISVHSPSVRPVPEEDGFVAHPGMMSEVSIWMKEVIRLPSPFKSKCITEYPELYEPFGTPEGLYTIKQCRQACLDYYLWETCGCVQQLHLVESNETAYTQCSMFDIKQRNCTHGVYLKFEDLKCDDCKPECHEIVLQTSLSHSKWPTKEYERMKIGSFYGRQQLASRMLEELIDNGEWAYNEWVSDNLVRLHVYYGSLSYERIAEERAYTSARLFSDLGGVFGFYLGMSITTLIECAQLVFMLIITKSKDHVEPENQMEDIYSKEETDPDVSHPSVTA